MPTGRTAGFLTTERPQRSCYSGLAVRKVIEVRRPVPSLTAGSASSTDAKRRYHRYLVTIGFFSVESVLGGGLLKWKRLVTVLVCLVLLGVPASARGASHRVDDPGCSGQSSDCDRWAYWASSAPGDPQPQTTDTSGRGQILDEGTWEHSDTIVYGRGPSQEIGRIFVLVNLSVDDLDPSRVFLLMRSEVESGPEVRMTHRYECREDDFRDRDCEGGPAAEEDMAPGFQDEHDTEDFAQHPRDKRDKIFWNFGFRWAARGVEDCCFFVPTQSSKRYECAGREGCFFDLRSNG